VIPVDAMGKLSLRFAEWLESMECRVYRGRISDFLGEVLPDTVIVPAALHEQDRLGLHAFKALVIHSVKLLPELPAELRSEKVVLCRPCEGGAIIELCKRNQLERDFVLFGIYSPCSRREYCTVRFSDFDVFVFEVLEFGDCASTAVFIKKGGAVGSEVVERVKSVTKRAELSLEWIESELEDIERAERFLDSCKVSITEFFDRCMKCMGCVFECPVCVCEEFCFAKEAGRCDFPPPPPQFLAFRMLHIADSCVNCGACDEACCANIPLSLIFQKVQRKYWKETGYIPGIDYELSPRMR